MLQVNFIIYYYIFIPLIENGGCIDLHLAYSMIQGLVFPRFLDFQTNLLKVQNKRF